MAADMTPDDDLSALDALAEKATPGPWRACPHVAGTDSECPCRYRGDVVSEATGEALFQMGMGPGDDPSNPEDDSWKGVKAPSREQGYVNGRYLAALDPATVRRLVAEVRRGGELDRAWQEAEAALPEGWRPLVGRETGGWWATASEPYARDGSYSIVSTSEHGTLYESMAAALTALASKLLAAKP